jgi:hypothetical protein
VVTYLQKNRNKEKSEKSEKNEEIENEKMKIELLESEIWIIFFAFQEYFSFSRFPLSSVFSRNNWASPQNVSDFGSYLVEMNKKTKKSKKVENGKTKNEQPNKCKAKSSKGEHNRKVREVKLATEKQREKR